MQFIDSQNKTLQCATGQGIALPYTALDFTTVYVVNTQATAVERGPKCVTGYLDNTFRNLLPSPTADYTEHDIKSIHVTNTDSITHTLTFRVVDSGNARVIFKCTLQPNYSVAYYNEEGWKIFSSTGIILLSTSINWGDILGTLSDQSDLQSALNAKASLTGTETLTNKRITKRVVTAADATSITPNTDNSDTTYQSNTQAAGTLTINADTGTPTNDQEWVLIVKTTNAQTFSFNAIYISMGIALPTTSVAGKRTLLKFRYDTDTSKWGLVGYNQEA